MNLRAITYTAATKVNQVLKGQRASQIWRFLEQSQWWSDNDIREFQDKELRSLIQHAYENIVYYRKVMDEYGIKPQDIQTTNDLIKLPILSKELLRNNWNELISTQAHSFIKSVRKTGGSTGEPLEIMVESSNQDWENAAFRRGVGFAGYTLGENMIKLFGGTLGLKPESLRRKLISKLSGIVFLPAFEISEETLVEYVNKIRWSKAQYLRGYTSAIYQLAKLMEDAGLNAPLKAIFPTAETLYEFQRETIEKSFPCEVFNQYGCGECNSIAIECSSHNGLHVSDEHVFIEALKGKERVEDGIMGALTMTTLHNYVMPLIRYQNSDVVSLTRTPCSCGRSLSRILKIHGRTSDLLLRRDGQLVSGSFVPHLFRNSIGIKQIQVLQESVDVIHLKVIKTDKFVDNEFQKLLKAFYRYFGDIHINVQYVNSISKTKQGKLRFVISKFGDQILY